MINGGWRLRGRNKQNKAAQEPQGALAAGKCSALPNVPSTCRALLKLAVKGNESGLLSWVLTEQTLAGPRPLGVIGLVVMTIINKDNSKELLSS